jgi:serpin B
MILKSCSVLLLFCGFVFGDVGQQFTASSNKFATDLYQKIAAVKDGNVIMSPLSIQSATSLAYFGTSGKTEQDMKSAMHYDSLSKTQIADSFADLQEKVKGTTGLKIANKIFVKNGFTVKPTFNEVATKSFESKTESVDFAQSQKAAKIINDWVESKTNNKIKDLIKSSSLDSDTRMILVNAIYFKGAWVHQFDKKATRKSPFFLDEQKSVDTDFMFIKKYFRYGVFPELDATVLELPYKDTDITLLIILPNSKTGLSSLEARLNQIDLNEISSKLFSRQVHVYLPKFKIEYEVNLNNILMELGMGRMFSDNAEFTELLETSERLKVSKAVHKAFIEVNEEGAEAAAATALQIMRLSAIRGPRTNFEANHPFLFALKSNTQNIFMGRFVKPK